MPWFVKHETFTAETAALPIEQRRSHLQAHRAWVEKHLALGMVITTGFLVDEEGLPGGGGLLIVEADSYAQAFELLRTDPMIARGLVNWTLQQWMPVTGSPQMAILSSAPDRPD